MSDSDAQIEAYHSLNPNDFHELEHLIVCQTSNDGVQSVSLEVCLRSKLMGEGRRLTLWFGGVRNLRLIPADSSVLSFVYIEVRSIGDQQWEDIHYRVFTTEQDSEISFICRDFDARLS